MLKSMIKLRDYQERIAEEACALLCTHGMAYLALAVRTGKTITALYTAELLRKHSMLPMRTVVFLTKKKAIESIQQDFARLAADYVLLVMNYEQVKIGNKWLEDADLFILDEAHGLGQYPKPAERTKLLRSIIGRKPVIYLSGTPSPESYSQLFHQFWVSARSPFPEKTFYEWAKAYVNVYQVRFGHGLVNNYSKAKESAIMEKVGHLFLRFSQEDAGFTQLVEEEILTVRMEDRTYAIVDKLVKKRVIVNQEGETVLADTAVKLLNKLHQLYSGSVIVDEPSKYAKALDMSKGRYIRDNFAGQKIAVFYKFKAEAVILRATLGRPITESPEEFQAGGADMVFISQIQSGREGVNLSTADALVMMNIDFSAVSYFQARARLQTKDRTEPAKVYWLFSDGGIEAKIYERVKAKKDYTVRYFKTDYKLKDEATDI